MSFRCVVIALFLLVAGVFGQSNRGGIGGSVKDTSGAAIPNAAVTITNVGTGETRHIVSGQRGDYVQENLDPATYRIEVDAPGFKKEVLQAVKVDTATMATANVKLSRATCKRKSAFRKPLRC